MEGGGVEHWEKFFSIFQANIKTTNCNTNYNKIVCEEPKILGIISQLVKFKKNPNCFIVNFIKIFVSGSMTRKINETALKAIIFTLIFIIIIINTIIIVFPVDFYWILIGSQSLSVFVIEGIIWTCTVDMMWFRNGVISPIL